VPLTGWKGFERAINACEVRVDIRRGAKTCCHPNLEQAPDLELGSIHDEAP
jgi:hypothetical protein